MPVLSWHPRIAESGAKIICNCAPIAKSRRPDGIPLTDERSVGVVPGPRKKSAERLRAAFSPPSLNMKVKRNYGALNYGTVPGGISLTGGNMIGSVFRVLIADAGI